MDVTDLIGNFGRYQLRILLVALYQGILMSFTVYNYMFISKVPNYECDDEYFESNAFAENGTFSSSIEDWRECSMFSPGEDDAVPNGTLIPCQKWKYPSDTTTSIVQEWNLVCSRKWMISLGYLVYSISGFIFYVPAGVLSDRFGRRKMILMGTVILLCVSVGMAYTRSYVGFLATRFLLAVGVVSIVPTSSCLVVEVIGAKRRFMSSLMLVSWGLGIMFMSAFSLLEMNWRYRTLAVTIPFQIIYFLLVWNLVPESSRWMLSRKQFSKAKVEISRAMTMNGKDVSNFEDDMVNLKRKIIEDDEREVAQLNILQLLKDRRIRRVLLIIYLTHFSRSFIRSGMEIYIVQLKGSLAVNFSLLGLSRILVSAFIMLAVKFINRKAGLLGFPLISAICCFIVATSQILKYDMGWLEITLTLAGSMATSISGSINYYSLIETVPTNLRVTAISSYFICSRIGSTLSSFVDLLGRMHGSYIPSMMFAVLSLLSALSAFFLVETKDVNLPDTVQESKNLVSSPGSEVTQSNVPGTAPLITYSCKESIVEQPIV